MKLGGNTGGVCDFYFKYKLFLRIIIEIIQH